MNFLKYIPEVGDWVKVPNSSLSKRYGIGQVIASWHDTVQIDFSGHLGQYTVSKHDFERAEFLGMKIHIDETLPINEIQIRKSE